MANGIFLSYTNVKDLWGHVTQFRDHLEAELKLKTGDAQITVFQDKRDIHAGDDFAEKLASELDSAKLLLILLSPLWLNRPWCRAEYLRFRKSDSAGTTRRPIVSVIWDETSDEDAKDPESQAILADLNDGHKVNWTGVKYQRWDTSEPYEAISKLAMDIKRLLPHEAKALESSHRAAHNVPPVASSDDA